MKNTVYMEIEKAKTEHMELLNVLRERLKAVETEAAENRALAAKVLESGSAEEYAKAKALEREAADKAEFYSIKIAEVEKQPLFEEPELREKEAALREDADKTKEKEMKAAIEAIKNGYDIICGLVEYLETANNAIDDLGENSKKKPHKIDVFTVSGVARAVNAVSVLGEVKPYWK